MTKTALALTLLLAGSATAAGNPKATALSKDAERAYKDNKYREAAELLKQAYALEPTPKFLYNLGRSWDQAGEMEEALDAYRRYVGLPSDESEPDLVKKANLAMDRLRSLLAKQEANKEVQDREKLRLEEEARAAKLKAEQESKKAKTQRETYEAKEQAAHDAANKSASGRKIAAFVVGGVGAAALGTAVGFGLSSLGTRSDFGKATTVEAKRSLESSTKTQAAVADIALVVGVAAAVTAVILFPKGDAPEGSVSVVVAPVQGGAIAAVGVRF